MLIQQALKEYRADITKFARAHKEWVDHGGKDGRGGKWDRRSQQYDPAPEPVEPSIPNVSEFEKRMLEAVKQEILKKI